MHQMVFYLVLNKSKKSNYNPNLERTALLTPSIAGKFHQFTEKSRSLKPNLDCNYIYSIYLCTRWNSLWWWQINRKCVITIQIWFDSTWFREKFSVTNDEYRVLRPYEYMNNLYWLSLSRWDIAIIALFSNSLIEDI